MENLMYIDSDELLKKIEEIENKGIKNIIVQAPMESGKTRFFIDKILTNESCCVFSNRALLKEQIQSELSKVQVPNISKNSYCYQVIGDILKRFEYQYELLKDCKIYGPDNVNKMTKEEILDSDDALVELTYNSTLFFLKSNLNMCSRIILDECHYFTSDSRFNENTFKEFEYLFNHTGATKIYFSATPETFISALQKYFEVNSNKLKEYNTEIAIINPFENIINNLIEINSSKYSIEFINYNDREVFLDNQIKNSNQRDKLLYFTSDKLFGFAMCNRANGSSYHKEFSKGGSIIYSLASKDSDKKFEKYIDCIQRQNIKQNNIFNTDVLVATKVLENGINLKDDNLKRIVTDYVEWDSVIQMIGRVRVKKRETAEPIKVYIIVPSIKMLKSRINKKKKLLEDDSKNLFEKEQAIFDIKSYEALKVMNSNGTRDLSSYIEKIKEFLFLKDSNFDTEKLEQSEYKLYQEIKKRNEEKEELQLFKENQDIVNFMDRLEFYYSEYGNKDLDFQEFRELAKLIKIPNNSKSRIITSVKKINLVINDFGYTIEQRRFGKKGINLYTFKTKDTGQHIL